MLRDFLPAIGVVAFGLFLSLVITFLLVSCNASSAKVDRPEVVATKLDNAEIAVTADSVKLDIIKTADGKVCCAKLGDAKPIDTKVISTKGGDVKADAKVG